MRAEEERPIPAAEEPLQDRPEKIGNRIDQLKIDLRTSQHGMAA